MANFKPLEDYVFSYPLTKPIQAFGDEIKEIRVREPTISDLSDIGLPIATIFDNNGSARPEYDVEKCLRMLNRLSTIPVGGSLDRLKASDAIGIYMRMWYAFFLPTAGTAE